MISTLAIANYRSLRSVIAPLGPLNLVSGENGSGKSSLYRALRLLAETAQGGVVASIAREGGLSSTLWAGRPGEDQPGHAQGRAAGAGRPAPHPDLLPALAALEESGSCNSLRLTKDMGETQIVGQSLMETPAWQWPAR